MPQATKSKTTILQFAAEDVEPHATHTKTADRRQPTFGQRYDPDFRHDGEEPDPEAEGFPEADEVDFTAVPPGFHS
jgi:hypothetical protein